MLTIHSERQCVGVRMVVKKCVQCMCMDGMCVCLCLFKRSVVCR